MTGVSELAWQKSTFSSNAADCVEVALAPDGTIALRESDRPGDIVTTTPAKLRAFIAGVKAGEFDHFGD
jgi:hypothetical protein